MASLVLDNLTKRFGDGNTALDGVSLSVKDGESMVVVGPSGSGKTTLLRLIAGLDEPTAGRVLIDGRTVNGRPPEDRNIAMVFQHPAIYPHMTVSGNIGFPLKMRGIPKEKIAQLVRDVAEMLGISDLLKRMPSTLSGGQAQRVALAKSLVRRPAVCLLDEPLSSLDPALRSAARADIRRLQKQVGTTQVYVTHDQFEAMTLGDRIAVICEGRLQQVGPPLELYDQPANRFVASFLGSPAMNFINGELLPSDGQTLFISSGGASIELTRRPAATARQRIVFGIRPEKLSLQPDGVKGPYLDVTVTRLEPVGDRILMHTADASSHSVAAWLDRRAGSVPPQKGSQTRLYFDTNEIHLFQPGPFGANLTS